MSARQAAALCSISLATWHRWQAAERCPAPVRIGATVRWRADELAAWCAAGCPDRKTWEALRAAQHNSRRG
jgi:predicted DNA-binding transcriptional regulator AlpA